MTAWTDPAWLAEAHAWIGEHADPVGPIEQPHVLPWSTVLRVPTANGDVWFKANTPELRYEAAVVTLLAERRPDCVPPLLAADLDSGWMLMADAGTQLRELVERERDLGRWLDVLPLYAGVQVDLAADADALVALGAPDVRLAGLVDRYERLLDGLEGVTAAERRQLAGLVPEIAELRDELAAHGIPETIQHDDFHDGQVYFQDGSYLLLDWGDACVSHPFFTLAVTLGGVIQWGLDDVEGSVELAPFRAAYLEPFDGDAEELVAAAVLAQRLGWVCRSVNGHLPEDAEATRTRLRMFVDGRP